MDLETLMRKNMIRAIVQRDIVCPVSGHVLDMDRDIVLVDEDGDPIGVVHHTVREALSLEPMRSRMAEQGWSIMAR